MLNDFNFQDAFSHLEDSVTEAYSLQNDSKKESVLQTKRFIIQTILSVAALIAAVVAAVAAVVPLM